MTITRQKILISLIDKPHSVIQISKKTKMSMSLIMKLMPKMMKKNLIKKTRVLQMDEYQITIPRYYFYELTEKGKEMIKIIEKIKKR